MRWTLDDALDIAEILRGFLGVKTSTEIEDKILLCTILLEFKPYNSHKNEKYAILIAQQDHNQNESASSTTITLSICWSRVLGVTPSLFPTTSDVCFKQIDLADPDSLNEIRAYAEKHFPGLCI